MSKAAVSIKNWPFEKGEKVKLTWIGEPFKQNNKWMVFAYFKGTRSTKRVLLDWASIHFLSIDKYYTDGNLNNSEASENTEIIDINLYNIKSQYNEKDWNISGIGFNIKTKSKTFNFSKNGVFYSVPIIEVIRAVLAPDKFMLNRILEMDTLENYFIYELNERALDIHFTSQYDPKLLKSEKINHLAWILTNESALRMFNSVGKSIWDKGQLKYEFLLDRFNIKARVKRKDKCIMILEIISLYKKRINAEEINIFHPSLEESITSNEAKKRKYISKNKNSDRDLDTDADGSTKESEAIDTFMLNHEYEKIPKINKKRNCRKIIRKKEDEYTQIYLEEDSRIRTVADIGGEKVIKGLEFTNISNVEAKGELEEFIEVLKLLEKRSDIRSINITIGELPEGRNGKRFSRLSDRITKRKYAIGKIVKIDGKECVLIEIEREDKALSMLILKANNLVNWKKVCSILLLGLVKESGKWNNGIISKIENQKIEVIRKKHITNNINRKVEQIYEVLY